MYFSFALYNMENKFYLSQPHIAFGYNAPELYVDENFSAERSSCIYMDKLTAHRQMDDVSPLHQCSEDCSMMSCDEGRLHAPRCHPSRGPDGHPYQVQRAAANIRERKRMMSINTGKIESKWTVFQTASFTKAKATKADACEEENLGFYSGFSYGCTRFRVLFRSRHTWTHQRTDRLSVILGFLFCSSWSLFDRLVMNLIAVCCTRQSRGLNSDCCVPDIWPWPFTMTCDLDPDLWP